jgi:general secretion pathway protein A
MYEAYWNLTSKPFAYRVESADLYRTRTLQSAALRLRYCFDNNAGAALLLGASGMGKSSLLQCLRSESSELYPFVHVAYATLTPAELSRTVAAEILGDQSIDDLPGGALLSTLHRALRKHADAGQHTVIAFDEAHLLEQQPERSRTAAAESGRHRSRPEPLCDSERPTGAGVARGS